MAGGRHARRRRSALQTPGFVDRIDLPDDAAGRVVLFSLEAPVAGSEPSRSHRAPALLGALAGWVGAVADDPMGAVVVGVALVLVLVLGLRLTH